MARWLKGINLPLHGIGKLIKLLQDMQIHEAESYRSSIAEVCWNGELK